MRPVLALRIASVLTFIHAVLHTVGGVFGAIPPGPASIAVEAMKSNQFVALGVTRTFWQYYHGMGLAVSIFLFIEAIVFWQLSSLAKTIGPQLRPVFASFMAAYLAIAVNSYLYFFLAPVIFEIVIALCFLWAILSAKPAST
ncbi:MAG TPA: hypothetical protein VHE33_00520 [Acidobacteriaceae bacterium]|nr:hypothetical protein [Acidobacteriaceae bacterium]